MIKKETFVSIMEILKTEMKNAHAISDEINDVFIRNGRPYNEKMDISDRVFSYELYENILESLQNEFGEFGELLLNFVFECNWGETPLNDDGTVTTTGELYDYLKRKMCTHLIKRKVQQNTDKLLPDNDYYLSQILYEKYKNNKNEKSGYYLVLMDYGQYKRGRVYKNLCIMSNIHPSLYEELTWGEFYKYCGCFDYETYHKNNCSECVLDSELRNTFDILNDFDNNSLH